MESIGGGKVGVNGFGSNIILDTFNNRVFYHEVFGVSKRFTIGPSGILNIVVDPTENGAFPKNTFVILPFSIEAKGAGPINVDIYAGTDSDPDGTMWDSVDRNFNDPVTAHAVVRLNPTINSDGVLTPTEAQVQSAAGQGNSSDIGGNVKGDFLILPRSDIRYMIRLTNTDSSNSGYGVFGLNWFEV